MLLFFPESSLSTICFKDATSYLLCGGQVSLVINLETMKRQETSIFLCEIKICGTFMENVHFNFYIFILQLYDFLQVALRSACCIVSFQRDLQDEL